MPTRLLLPVDTDTFILPPPDAAADADAYARGSQRHASFFAKMPYAKKRRLYFASRCRRFAAGLSAMIFACRPPDFAAAFFSLSPCYAAAARGLRCYACCYGVSMARR